MLKLYAIVVYRPYIVWEMQYLVLNIALLSLKHDRQHVLQDNPHQSDRVKCSAE